jgi:hypothetical protein
MSQSTAIAHLALRELWISFRLLVLLVGFVAAGVVVALVPAPFPVRADRWVLGVTVASALAGALAAWSLAVERRSGRAGWLVSRSVPRATQLGGWFLGMAASTLLGLATIVALGWFALPVGAVPDPGRFAQVTAAVAAAALVWIGLGLLAGAVAPPPAACLAIGLAGGALVAARILGAVPDPAAWLFREATSGDLVRLTGGLLALAGVLLGAGLVAIGRAEL